MENGKMLGKIACRAIQVLGVATLALVALWRNDVAYKAELKAINLEKEKVAYRALSELRGMQIKKLEKKLSEKKEES